MGEIADWTIDQMLDIDNRFMHRVFSSVLTFDTLSFTEQREVWKWHTKDKQVYKLCELADQHITNIIPCMERRKTERELLDERQRPEWIAQCNKTIKLMRTEQRYRKKHNIVVNVQPIMKIVHHRSDK